MDKIVIYGNKSVARLAYFNLKYYTSYEIVGFTVDRDYIKAKELFGIPITPFDNISALFPPSEYKMFVAVGYVKTNKIREERYLQAKEMGYQFVNIVSNTATTYPDLAIGENCLIGPNTVIYPDVKIGNNVIIGSGCTLDHDLVLGDNCFLSDRVAVSGYVKIMENCFLGTNSMIRNKVVIGRETIIGAGTNIMEDTDEKSVYFCEPSKKLSITSDRLNTA